LTDVDGEEYIYINIGEMKEQEEKKKGIAT